MSVIQTHIVNGLYFEVVRNTYEIEKVLLDGKELERIRFGTTSRKQYRLTLNGVDYRIKFDDGGQEGWIRTRTSTFEYQSTFEAEVWEKISVNDRKYFAPLFGASPAPFRVPNHMGFVIQPEIKFSNEHVFSSGQAQDLRRISEKYKIGDINIRVGESFAHNTAMLEDGSAVIYDWGVKIWEF